MRSSAAPLLGSLAADISNGRPAALANSSTAAENSDPELHSDFEVGAVRVGRDAPSGSGKSSSDGENRLFTSLSFNKP